MLSRDQEITLLIEAAQVVKRHARMTHDPGLRAAATVVETLIDTLTDELTKVAHK